MHGVRRLFLSAPRYGAPRLDKGGREKNDMKVTYICRSPKTKIATCFILFFLDVFIAFLGVS
jgi:hypothetical protein